MGRPSEKERRRAAERELAALRGAVDQIADQLCWAVDGRLDFTVRAACPDDTVEKLAMLVNFLLDAARRAVEALEERNQRLVELDRVKAQFFANVSHELRTPLTLIRGPVEGLLARAEAAGDAAGVASLHRVRRNADRLSALVEDLLDVSRLEAGAARVSWRPADPAAIVRAVVDDAQESARALGSTLTYEAPPPADPIALDPEKFEKVTLNLVSNALKFTPAGGRITVGVARKADTLELRVTDTGPGIPEADRALLFQRFSQLDASPTRRHAGTGLGLAIVREFAELMGGSVRVTSELGRGSTFVVELPARTLAGATPSAPAPLPRPRLAEIPPPVSAPAAVPGRTRVVVAEDNPDLLAYLLELLSPTYAVFPAANGREALALVRSLRPSLLLGDVMMPGLDGLELTRRIKADPATRDVIVVLLTARGGDEAVAEGLEAGADDYVRKPFGRLELEARLRAALRTRRLAEEVARAAFEREQRERVTALYEEARAAEERYRGLVEGLDAIVWEADAATGACTFMSGRGLALLGFTPAASPAPGLLEAVVHADDLARAQAGMAAAARGEPARIHCRVRTAAGEWRWVVATMDHVAGGVDGARVRCVMVDVTESRRAEEALRQREARLLQAEKLESLGRLAGEVAHDFNNILAAIVGYARLIERRSDDAAAVARHAAGIRSASERAATLIAQLLQFSRRRAVDTEAVDVGFAAERMLDMLGRLVGESIRVRLQVERPLPPVLLPPGQVEQVILNLVVNARDAMPAGGAVDIHVRPSDGAAGAPGWVELCVADEGVGIDAPTLERLFEPFFTTKPEGRGTGLGLATVHAIVTKAGGRIAVTSEPGKGARFVVSLPACVPHPVAAVAPAAPARPRAPGPADTRRHVLLVEDQIPLRAILTEALEEAGYRVIQAGSADEALRKAAAAERVDAVVSDVVLGGMSGFELAERLQALHPAARFVYMSGFEEGARSPPGRPSGPLLHKPFSPAELQGALDEVFGRVLEPVEG